MRSASDANVGVISMASGTLNTVAGFSAGALVVGFSFFWSCPSCMAIVSSSSAAVMVDGLARRGSGMIKLTWLLGLDD